MSVNGIVSNISRCSLHDGSGIRTVIYFKGCNLKCKWCHNPETHSFSPDIMYNPNLCICCGNCISVCSKCHSAGETSAVFTRDLCNKCMRCADVCPTRALSVCGDEMTSREVFDIILNDSHYYAESGGGITLSGGECLLQVDFAVDILKLCSQRGINTAIESAMCVPWENISAVIPYTDCFFADIKHHDSSIHRNYTGVGNELILDNIYKLSLVHNCITLRIPLIPGINDSNEDMKKFGEIINGLGKGIGCVELLKYNYLAGSKYEALDKEYISYSDYTQTNEHLLELKEAMQNSVKIKVVCEI